MEFIQLFLFIIAIIFSFYIPGRVILEKLQIKAESLAIFLYSWILGIVLFILATYFLSYINFSFAYLGVLGICATYYLLKRKTFCKILFTNTDYLYLVFILFGSIAFSGLMFFSGLVTEKGMQFYGANAVDGVLHLAYIKDQLLHFPPENPGLAGMPLRGYHYFYDFLLSNFVRFYGFLAEDLYFRFFPLLISLVYGAGFLLASSLFTKEKVKTLFILFFAYFGTGFTFILLLLADKDTSIYGLSQPLELMLNPMLAFSVGILLAGISLIPKIDKSLANALLVALFIGILSQIKVYTGLIGIACLTVFSGVMCLKHRSIKKIKNYIVAMALAAFITIITYFPNNLGAGSLVFAPFLFYSHFMQQSYFQDWHWEIKRQIFAEHNNYPRIILLYVQAIGLFFILGLGMRVVVFLKAKSIFSRAFWAHDGNILIAIAMIVPVIIASFFVQNVSVFDIIQFFWLALMVFSIPSGIVFADIYHAVPSYAKVIVVTALVFLSATATINAETLFYKNLLLTVSNEELQFFEEIGKSIPKDEFVTVLPKGTYDVEKDEVHLEWANAPIIAAFSGRPTYYEKESTQFNLANVHEQRLKKIEKLYKNVSACNKDVVIKTMQEIGTDFLVTAFKVDCFDGSDSRIKRVANSHEMYLYQIVK